MFIQHVCPPRHPHPQSLHVVSGWASASVTKDRRGGEFTRSPLSQTTALPRRLCPCFLSRCRDFPSPHPSQLFWFLITQRGRPNEVPAWLDSICPSFSSWERTISLENTSLQKQTYPTPTSPFCLELVGNVLFLSLAILPCKRNKNKFVISDLTKPMWALWTTMYTLKEGFHWTDKNTCGFEIVKMRQYSCQSV